PDPELGKHLEQCKDCRSAMEDALLAGNLLRQVSEPAIMPRPAFLAGVMARIAVEMTRLESPAAFWTPLEFLASRVSLTAAVVLLALSAYLVEAGPQRNPVELTNRTELSASDFPQPPRDPVSNEEILQSLAERNHGR
ncbi:MAG: hypothetical protein ACRD3S_08550, partial [Terracidiphilus sp.]